MSQDSWTMRKGKMRISWVWKMRNDHYGVRKKARKHGKWGMKQDSSRWKFGTQNLVATCTLNLKSNLEYFPKSILYILYNISNIGKSGVQCFKQFTNWSKNKEVTTIWRQWTKLEGHFEMISKFNLWFRNSTYEFEIHFEMTPILNSPAATLMFRLLYLRNCI